MCPLEHGRIGDEKLPVVERFWPSGCAVNTGLSRSSSREKSRWRMLEPAGPSEIDSKPETELTCPCAFSIDQGLSPSVLVRYFATGISIGLPFQSFVIQS